MSKNVWMVGLSQLCFKIILLESTLCSRTDCFIRVYWDFRTVVLELVTALLEYLDLTSDNQSGSAKKE